MNNWVGLIHFTQRSLNREISSRHVRGEGRRGHFYFQEQSGERFDLNDRGALKDGSFLSRKTHFTNLTGMQLFELPIEPSNLGVAREKNLRYELPGLTARVLKQRLRGPEKEYRRNRRSSRRLQDPGYSPEGCGLGRYPQRAWSVHCFCPNRCGIC